MKRPLLLSQLPFTIRNPQRSVAVDIDPLKLHKNMCHWSCNWFCLFIKIICISCLKDQNVTVSQCADYIKCQQIHIYLNSVTKNNVGNVRWHVIVWRFHVTIVVMRRQQCIIFVMLTYICRCQQCNKCGSTALRSLYCCANISLPTILHEFRSSWQTSTKYGFAWQIFLNVPNTKYHENPPSGGSAYTCGHTDGHWRS